MERTIRVTGKGNLSVKPDTVRLNMTMEGMKEGKVRYKLGHSPVRPEFRIEYTVAEPEKCKNELLKNAVTDAKAKADVLSKASGVSLGEIITIDYSWAEIDFVSRPMDKLMLEECCVRSCEPDETYDIDINPDDIDVTDNVTVVWGIK